MGNNSVPKFIFRLSRFPVYRGSVLGRFYCISSPSATELRTALLLPKPNNFCVTQQVNVVGANLLQTCSLHASVEAAITDQVYDWNKQINLIPCCMSFYSGCYSRFYFRLTSTFLTQQSLCHWATNFTSSRWSVICKNCHEFVRMWVPVSSYTLLDTQVQFLTHLRVLIAPCWSRL